MEQARYGMWTKSKYINKFHVDASAKWRGEEAFEEDAAGPFGPCIWPPRSYRCSFCRREFTSAQALGGHMNVHRGDRARLRQSPSVVESPLSPSRVSSTIQERDEASFFSSPPSWSDSITTRSVFNISDSMIDGEKTSMKPYSELQNEDDYVKPGSTVSLNLLVGHGEDENISCKRHIIDEPSLPFFLKPCSFSRRRLQSQIIGLSPGAIEDLDLELRLGDRPKVK